MIERLVPAGVAVVSTREEMTDVELFAEEEALLRRAVEKRRREFVTGRACARLALGRLGIGPVAIASGARGEPLWPTGIVGSITHCSGYRACAVAWAADVLAVGIDAEVHRPLPAGVIERIAFGSEPAMVADRAAGVHLDTLLFSAKEAVYKAWFPLTHRWLGFEEAELTIDLDAAAFRARLLVPGPVTDRGPLSAIHGRWAVEGDIVATAAVVLAGGVAGT